MARQKKVPEVETAIDQIVHALAASLLEAQQSFLEAQVKAEKQDTGNRLYKSPKELGRMFQMSEGSVRTRIREMHGFPERYSPVDMPKSQSIQRVRLEAFEDYMAYGDALKEGAAGVPAPAWK